MIRIKAGVMPAFCAKKCTYPYGRIVSMKTEAGHALAQMI